MAITSNQLLDYLYTRKLPQIYRDKDVILGYPLKRYLESLVLGGFAPVIAETEKLLTLVDPEKCPSEFLPLLCYSFGLDYFEDIDETYQRKFLMNIGEIVRRRGTYSCIRYMTSVLTGLDVELTCTVTVVDGKNVYTLTVTLLANTLDQVQGMSTSMTILQRFLTAQVPYFINIEVTSRINTQLLQSNVYKRNVIVMHKHYDIGMIGG